MRKSITFAAAGLFIVAIAVYAGGYFFGPGSAIPPGELAHRALTAPTPAERERAALDLAASPAGGIKPMRDVLAKTDSPQVKSHIIQGLGAHRDWESMPTLLEALSDPSEQVRERAGVAVNAILGVDYLFRANDPVPKREAAIKSMHKRYQKMLKAPPPSAQGTPP